MNDTIKIDKIEPFSEDFPIRDREKQTDMLNQKHVNISYYVVINSNDRNITNHLNLMSLLLILLQHLLEIRHKRDM